MPKTYIIGNWKMNQGLADIESFFSGLNVSSGNFWLAPQSIHLDKCLLLAKDKGVLVGTQNCSNQDNGAFTGEISCSSIKEMGAKFVIVGHSERRAYFLESDQLINQKVVKAIENQLIPVICIGETLDQRESNQTLDVVLGQLTKSLSGIELSSIDECIIAYEPVWAIGTGKTATAEQAEEVHKAIRARLIELYPELGEKISILYGGSVKPSNIEELLLMPNINGALVGGASLDPNDFNSLCKKSGS